MDKSIFSLAILKATFSLSLLWIGQTVPQLGYVVLVIVGTAIWIWTEEGFSAMKDHLIRTAFRGFIVAIVAWVPFFLVALGFNLAKATVAQTPPTASGPVTVFAEATLTNQYLKAKKDIQDLISAGCELLKAIGNEDGSYKSTKWPDLNNDWEYDVEAVLNREVFLTDKEFRHWHNTGDEFLGGVGWEEMDKSNFCWPVQDAPKSAYDLGLYRKTEIRITNLQYYVFELNNRLKGIKKSQPPEALKMNKVKCL